MTDVETMERSQVLPVEIADETVESRRFLGLKKKAAVGFMTLAAAVGAYEMLSTDSADAKTPTPTLSAELPQAKIGAAISANTAANLQGLNQIHLMNIYPSDRPDLATSMDAAICNQGRMLGALFEKRGWPGWAPRIHPGVGNCEFDIYDLAVSPESVVRGMNATQISNDIDSHMRAAGLNHLEYFMGFWGDSIWPSANTCDITEKVSDSTPTVLPAVKNFGVLRMNQNGCDLNFTPTDGFTGASASLAGIMFPNFAFANNNIKYDLMGLDTSGTWAVSLFDYHNQAGYGPIMRKWPYGTWLVEKTVGGSGQGTITEHINDYTREPILGYKNDLPNHPLAADPGSRYVAGSDIIFTAKDQLGSHFKQWLVEAPDPLKGPDLPGRIDNPYAPISVPNPTSPTLEIDGLDRSYKIEAVFEKDATNPQKKILKIMVGRGGSVRGTGGIAVVNAVRTSTNVMQHSYPEAQGQRITLFEKPAAGKKFAGWYGACRGLVSKCVVVMNANKTVGARFK